MTSESTSFRTKNIYKWTSFISVSIRLKPLDYHSFKWSRGGNLLVGLGNLTNPNLSLPSDHRKSSFRWNQGSPKPT